MSKKRKYSLVLSIITCISTLVSLAIPIISSYIVDEALALSKVVTKDYSKLILYIIIASCSIAILIFLKLVECICLNKFQIKREKELKNRLYLIVSSKKVEALAKYKIAWIEQLFKDDVDNIVRCELDVIPKIANQATRFLVSVALLIYIDWLFLVIIAVVGIVCLIGARIYSKVIKSHHKNVLETNAKANSFVIETFEHFKLLKGNSSISNACEYYKDVNDINMAAKRKRNRLIYSATAIIFSFSNIVYIFAIIYCGLQIARNSLSYGDMIALIQLLANVQNPLLGASQLINHYNLASASIERIKMIDELPDDNLETVIDDFDILVAENVSFEYDKTIIDNLSFEIKKGDYVRISGPSGVGKTTLLMLILGFIVPKSGRLFFVKDGLEYEISGKTRKLFSYVTQENTIFSGSIFDNLHMLSGKNEEEIIDALKLTNIYDEIMELPNGIYTMLAEGGSGLSIGQIQRLLISAAILCDSKIILLDEFTSALDSENERIVMDNIKKLNKTIIYITHKKTSFVDSKEIKIK